MFCGTNPDPRHEPREALHEQTGADQQHQRQGDFRRDQQAPQPLVRDGGSDPASSRERAVDVLPEHRDGGRAAERQGRQDDEAAGESKEPTVHGDLRQARHVDRHQRRDRVDGIGGQHEAAESAQRRDRRALGQQLPQQARGPATDRRSNGELLLARA